MTRQMTSKGVRATKRVLVLFALVAAGLAVTVTGAQAEVTTNEHVTLAYAGYVPCANGGAGEIVHGTVEMHNVIGSTTNRNNVSDRFHFQLEGGSMIGAVTGDTYRVTGVTSGSTTESLQNGHYNLTYVNTFRLLGPGPGNNLLVREIAHVTIDGDDVVVSHDALSIDCR